jgi:hypothetical protein
VRIHPVLVALLTGLVVGVITKWVDQAEIAFLARWGGLMLSQLGAWALVIVLLARWSRSPRAAAVQGAVFFLAMCTGYYAMTIWHYGFGDWVFLRVWGLASVTAVPALAAALAWATRVPAGRPAGASRRAEVVAGLVIAVPAGIALGEAVGMWEFFGIAYPGPAVMSAGMAVAAVALLARTSSMVAGAVVGALAVAYLTWQAQQWLLVVIAWLLPRL